MGKCISKINKDPFLVYEELIENYILFLKGKIRSIFETVGCNEGPFHDEVFRNNDVGSVTN